MNLCKEYLQFLCFMHQVCLGINLAYCTHSPISSELMSDTGKQSRFLKVFNVAGKRCITTVNKKKRVPKK